MCVLHHAFAYIQEFTRCNKWFDGSTEHDIHECGVFMFYVVWYTISAHLGCKKIVICFYVASCENHVNWIASSNNDVQLQHVTQP